MMTTVPSVLPDANIPAWTVARKFEHAKVYSPGEQAVSARDYQGEHYAYGLAYGSSAPEDVQLMDFLARHYQGHHLPGAYVGGRSGRYDWGLAGMEGMWPAYYNMLLARRSAAGYHLAGLDGLGQVCGDDGICVDDSGNIIGTVDTSGTYTEIPTQGPVFGPPVATAPPAGTLPSVVVLPSGQKVSTSDPNVLYAALATAGIDIAKLAIIQPGTSQAGGSITRQTPGFPVSPIATSTGIGVSAKVSTGAAIAGSTVALIGLGLVALMVMGGRRRGQ